MNISRKIPAMGKEIEIVFYNTNDEIVDVIMPEIEREERRLEMIFNFYNPDSELSKLNKSKTLEASNELLEVIKKALKLSKLTSGSYDVSLGRNFIERKSGKELTNLFCSYKNIEINNNQVSLTHQDVLIDLGSIAKGFITDKLVEFISSLGIESFLIDSRGDIRISGSVSEKINIQHPRDKEKIVGSFILKNRAVATSGDYNQFSGGYEKSHIVHASNNSSVTIIADNLTDADALATAIFVSDKPLKTLMEKYKNAQALVVKSSGEIIKHNWKNDTK